MKYTTGICLLLFLAPFTGIAQQDNGKKSFRFFAAVGINAETNETSNSSPYYISGGRTQTSNLPVFSGGINIYTDPDYQRVMLRFEISAALAKYKDNYNNGSEPQIPVRASFNATDLAFNPEVLYNFYNAENLKIYGGAGLSIAYSAYNNVYYGPQNPNDYFPVKNDYDFISFDTRAMLKAGVQIHQHFEAFFNYLTNAETTNRGYFQLNKKNNHIGVLYLF